MEEAKKMTCYKRLIYKQFIQVSGLCGPQFLSYLPKLFTHLCRALYGDATLRNRACRYASRLNANFCQSDVAPIICRWKLVKHRYCFGDNGRTKDNRKIKLCSLKVCCVKLISCSISHNAAVNCNPDPPNLGE